MPTIKTPKPKPNPVTEEARAAFEIYVREWQEKLGLGDWRINVSTNPTSKYAALLYKCDYEARTATIKLGTDLGSAACSPKNIEALAVHELRHVMLRELIVLCQDPNTPEDVLNSAEHRIINTDVRLLVPGSDL